MEAQVLRKQKVLTGGLEGQFPPRFLYSALSVEEEKTWEEWLPNSFGDIAPYVSYEEMLEEFSDEGIYIPKEIRDELIATRDHFNYYIVYYRKDGASGYEALIMGRPFEAVDPTSNHYLIGRFSATELIPYQDVSRRLSEGRRARRGIHWRRKQMTRWSSFIANGAFCILFMGAPLLFFNQFDAYVCFGASLLAFALSYVLKAFGNPSD